MPGKRRAKPRVTRREKLAKIQSLVCNANNAEDLLSDLIEWTSLKKYGLDLNVQFRFSKDIEQTLMDQVFDLLKTNMQEHYEKSSWGWSDEKKRNELTHKDARFFLVLDANGQLFGFCHFRFDVELNYPIIYLYEIQIDHKIQRRGVATHLMDLLFIIARKFKLAKIVLTCFLSNMQAINFYCTRHDFKRDETCPRGECLETGYLILSKTVDG